jgi:hypothetical protein
MNLSATYRQESREGASGSSSRRSASPRWDRPRSCTGLPPGKTDRAVAPARTRLTSRSACHRRIWMAMDHRRLAFRRGARREPELEHGKLDSASGRIRPSCLRAGQASLCLARARRSSSRDQAPRHSIIHRRRRDRPRLLTIWGAITTAARASLRPAGSAWSRKEVGIPRAEGSPIAGCRRGLAGERLDQVYGRADTGPQLQPCSRRRAGCQANRSRPPSSGSRRHPGYPGFRALSARAGASFHRPRIPLRARFDPAPGRSRRTSSCACSGKPARHGPCDVARRPRQRDTIRRGDGHSPAAASSASGDACATDARRPTSVCMGPDGGRSCCPRETAQAEATPWNWSSSSCRRSAGRLGRSASPAAAARMISTTRASGP